MSAEGKPHIRRSLLAKPLGLLTRLILQQPRTVVVASLVLAVIAVVLTATQLGFRNNRLDLLNPKSHYNQRWLRYLDEFGDEDDVVVVVEAADRAFDGQVDEPKQPATNCASTLTLDLLYGAVIQSRSSANSSSCRSVILSSTPSSRFAKNQS